MEDAWVPPPHLEDPEAETLLELDQEMSARLHALAALKRVPYETLLRQFVIERLEEEEERLGLG